MFLKGPLGAFGFLQEYASFVDPNPAIERPAKTTSISLAYFFKFVPLASSVRPKAAVPASLTSYLLVVGERNFPF